MRFATVVWLACLLSACAARYQPLAPETASSSYKKYAFNFGVRTGGLGNSVQSNPWLIYMKWFDSDGKLGMCGYYVLSQSFSGNARAMFLPWLVSASIYLEDTNIAPMFLQER